MQKINVMAQQSFSVQGVFKNQRGRQRGAGQINGKAFALEIDITSNSSIRSFLQYLISNHNRIDILIYTAGYPFNSGI
jgi:NADP-dependent 3-hydroxy acid dehydrogenase YdfG